MPAYNVTSPDGKKFKVNAPDGATQDQVLSYAKSQFDKTSQAPDQKFMLGSSEPNAIERGFLKAGIGTGQILDEVGIGDKIGLPSTQEYAGAARQLNQQGKGKGALSAIGEMAGNPYNIAAAIGAPETLPGRIAAATAGGAVSAASEPVTSGSTGKDFAKEKLTQAAEGAAGGAIGGTAMEGAGRVLAPKFDDAVKLLQKAGVKLTPGQLSTNSGKGILKNAESSATSIPIAGSLIKARLKDSIDSFNTAVLNESLKPIGAALPKGTTAGREAIAKTEQIIGDKYDALLPKLSFRLDNQFIGELNAFESSVKGRLPEAQQKQIEALWNSAIEPRLDANLSMDGRTFKTIDSELAYEARSYMKSQDPAQSAFGNAVQEMRGLFRDNLERMNPQHAAELSKINAAWAAFSRAQEASIRRPKSMGVFSPNDLAQTVKKSSTKGAFARGDGLLQDLADAGNQVIPGDVPDSGTTGRALWAGLLGYASQVDPHLAATAAAISAPYTSVGMKGINKWAQQPGPVRESLRAGAERATPAAGAVTGGSVADFLNPDQVNLQDGLNLGGNQ